MTDKYFYTTDPLCVFCNTTKKLMKTTDCDNICRRCLFKTHRKCCECKQDRIKTQYHPLSEYYDEEHIFCKDCFKLYHKCADCQMPFIPEKFEVTINGETIVKIKSRCHPCDYEHFTQEYKLNWLGLAPKGMRWTKGHLALEKC